MAKKYELRRVYDYDARIMTGTLQECRQWVEDSIDRNRYDFSEMENLEGNPLWAITATPYGPKEMVFYLKEITAINY